MSERVLKAVELLQRPPLTNIRERLRILADELPEDVEAVLVVTYPGNAVYEFGHALDRYQAIGALFSASQGIAARIDRDDGENG